MRTSPVALLILLTLFVTSACETVSVVEGDYCRIAKPIFYDYEKDTPDTVKQIERHNSQYVCVCELDCPKENTNG